MTNTQELKSRIEKSGYKLGFLANEMGLSRAGLQNKIYNKREFKTSEVKKLCEILSIGTTERDNIFFA